MSDYFLRTLFVHTAGTRLVLEGDAVRALKEDSPPRRLPLRAIDTIVVSTGVEVSNPLLLRCAEDGRIVAFVSRFGKPRAVVLGPSDGRGRVRRLQYRAHEDDGRRIELARCFVIGKLTQMAWGLRQWARDSAGQAREGLRDRADRILVEADAANSARGRGELLGIEGAASRRYFDGMATVLRDWNWTGRRRRPVTDPVNAALSYLYGMARISVHGGIHVAGLDPYCGYLHGDRDGQPALVLDLLEEFRPSVDRVAVTLFNRRQLRIGHFDLDAFGTCSLSEEGREVLMNAWHTHRMSKISPDGKIGAVARAALPLIQANVLANSLRSGSSYAFHRLAVR